MIIERQIRPGALRRPPYQKQAINDFVPTIYYATLDLAKNKGAKFIKWVRWLSQYFSGLFQENSGNELWYKYHNDFINLLIHNGELFVSYDKLNNEIILWEVRNKYYRNSTLISVRATKWNPNQKIIIDNGYVKQYTLINNIDGVYLSFINSQYKGLIHEWYDYINEFIKLENNYLNACLFDTKKWEVHYLGGDVNEARHLINSLTNDESPFIYIVNNIESGELKNLAIKPLEATQTVSKASQAFDNLKNYITFIFNNEGLAVPIDFKKERKTTSEAKVDIYNTYNTEGIILKNLEAFSYFFFKLTGIELNFERNA
ncbi:MAG: hypothetical protein E7Y34_01430, partial [Mycoplasma sp.]|nr:hypothetical protein [Mycoplasma sp.]